MTDQYKIPILPLKQDVETKAVLKRLAPAHRRLVELEGVAARFRTSKILINTLALQEPKDSSMIGNTITTHDELFKQRMEVPLIESM